MTIVAPVPVVTQVSVLAPIAVVTRMAVVALVSVVTLVTVVILVALGGFYGHRGPCSYCDAHSQMWNVMKWMALCKGRCTDCIA